MERQELIEHGTYPHSRRGTLLSLTLVLAFLIAVPILVNSLTSRLLTELSLSILVVYSIATYLRIRSFAKIRQQLKDSNAHTAPPPRRITKATIFLAGLLFIVGPFVAVTIVDPLTWLVGLGAIICGVNLAEMTLTIYVRRWVKTNQTQLTRFEIWDMNEYGRGKLRESGVRAEKFPNETPQNDK